MPRQIYLDQLFFWNARDLHYKLDQFRDSFNEHRVHTDIDGNRPNQRSDEKVAGLLATRTSPGSHTTPVYSKCALLPELQLARHLPDKENRLSTDFRTHHRE